MGNFLSSVVGRKYIMAISGLIWAGFVFAHMAGNLLIFVSKDSYNAYGHALTSGAIIYVVEAVLILALLGHVVTAVLLTRGNRKARGSVGYEGKSKSEKSGAWASKWMGVQGTIVLVFLILHIATFKYGTYYETTVNGVPMRDLHRLIVEAFQQPGFVAWYLFALVILGIHLSHGAGSTLQSLGIRNDRFACWIRPMSWTYAIVVAAGFISQPLYVMFGGQ